MSEDHPVAGEPTPASESSPHDEVTREVGAAAVPPSPPAASAVPASAGPDSASEDAAPVEPPTVLMTPGGPKMYALDNKFPISFACPIEIQLQENVTVNRGAAGTQIPVLDVVQFCMQRLHLWSPSNQKVNAIYLDETPFLLVTETPLLVYNVRFNAPLTIVQQ